MIASPYLFEATNFFKAKTRDDTSGVILLEINFEGPCCLSDNVRTEWKRKCFF